MPTDFNDLAYFGINNVQIDEKCWNCGVTFSSRTIFNFEQCVFLLKNENYNVHRAQPNLPNTRTSPHLPPHPGSLKSSRFQPW